MKTVFTTIFLLSFLLFLGAGVMIMAENAIHNPAAPFIIIITAIVCGAFYTILRWLLLKYDPLQQPKNHPNVSKL